MNPTSSDTGTASAITALGTLGILGYQLSQGQQVSATLGPGGAAVLQSGAAVTQTNIVLIVVGLVAVAFVAYLLLR